MIAPPRLLAACLLLPLGGCAGAPPAESAPQATGLFETQTEKAPAAGDWYAADLNVDGKDELLLTQPSARTRVYSFDTARGLDQTATLPAAKWLSIGDITADGLPDVLLGGTSFKGYRALDELSFSPLSAKSVPLTGEASGRLSVTSFPIVGRFHRREQPEPIVVKDVYDLSELSPKPTQIESFSATAGDVASTGNAELAVPLSLQRRFVAMDLDGDGLDELWGVDFGGNLCQLRPAPDADGPSWQVSQRWDVGYPAQLALDDANGDGTPDLVGVGSALVVTGGHDGAPGRVHQLELPSAARGCVWIQLDSDAERELACSAEDGAEPAVFDADFEHDVLTPRDVPELALVGELLVGDFDGNGVDDLVAIDKNLVISLGVAAP